MPYDPATQPKIWLPSDYLGADNLNREISDPLRYLLFERSWQQVLREGVADYTTSANAWADVDATNLSLDVTCKSTKLIAWATFYAQVNLSAVAGAFSFTKNGVRAGGTYGIIRQEVNNNLLVTVGPFMWTAVASGTYTIRLQYRSFAAFAVTIKNNGFPVLFCAADGW